MYKLSPSKAHRFLNCTASLKHDVEFVDTIYTARGTLLHELGEKLIKKEDVDDFIIENEINFHELEFLEAYANAVLEEFYFINATILDIEVIKPIEIYGFNTNSSIDALALSETTASIIDLKTGRNEISPFNNEQLYFYAYSVIMDYPNIKTIRLSIFQNSQMKTIVVDKKKVLKYFEKKAKVFEKIANDDLTYNPGKKACKYFSIRETCEARMQWLIYN